MTVSRYIDYTTRLGDTFDELALQVYNNEKMASEIITANPDYADVIIFDEEATPETLAPWRTAE